MEQNENLEGKVDNLLEKKGKIVSLRNKLMAIEDSKKTSLKTKWFGRKVKEENLEKLAEIFGVDIHGDFRAYDGWSSGDIYAKVSAKFQENSLKLTAYFHSTDFHHEYIDGEVSKTITRPGSHFTKIVEIPYEKLAEVLKDVSQTGFNK